MFDRKAAAFQARFNFKRLFKQALLSEIENRTIIKVFILDNEGCEHEF